jgi:hypothetical protein
MGRSADFEVWGAEFRMSQAFAFWGNKMRKLFYVFFILAISFSVQASTITYTDSVTGLFDLVPDRDLVIPQFDSSLGTLNSATINLSTALQGSLGFENLKKFTGGNFNVSTNNIYASLVISLNGSGIMMSNYMDNQTYTVTLAAYDGTTDYAGTSGTIVANFSDADTQTVSLSDPSFLAQFIGTGDLLFNIITDSLTPLSLPSNSSAIINTTGQASASITYDYTPIPEPATVCLISIGALSLIQRKKIK